MCAPQLPCKDRGWVLQLARCDETIWDPNKYIKLAGGGENCFGFVWRHPWSHSVKQNKIREKKKFCFQLFSCDIVCFKMKCFGFRWLKLQAQFQRKTSWFKKEYFSKTFLLFWSTAPSLCLSLECVCSCQSCGIWSYRLTFPVCLCIFCIIPLALASHHTRVEDNTESRAWAVRVSFSAFTHLEFHLKPPSNGIKAKANRNYIKEKCPGGDWETLGLKM